MPAPATDPAYSHPRDPGPVGRALLAATHSPRRLVLSAAVPAFLLQNAMQAVAPARRT